MDKREQRGEGADGRTSSLDPARLHRLIAVGRGLTSSLDLEQVLRDVLEAARDLTGARYAALGVLDERKRELERFLHLGVDEATISEIGDLPRGRGVLGALISDPRPLRLADVSADRRSYGFPPGHPPMRTFLGVPVPVRGEAWGNLYMTEKAGGAEFDAADEQAAVVLAGWAGIAVDNARLYEQVDRRRAELERAVQELRATSDIARAVGGETDLGRILELVVKRGRALVEARAMLIALVEGDDLVVRHVAGDLHENLTGMRMPLAGTVSGTVLRSGRPERLSEAPSTLRFPLAERLGASTALLVPLIYRGQGHGLLTAIDRLDDGPRFSIEDERLLISFAASAATAVATARSVAADRLRHSIEAAERERAQWARELHDDTLQSMAGLRLLLSTARRTPESLGEAVERAVGQLEDGIASLRGLIADLRPAALDELGLDAALEGLAERARVLGGRVEIDIDLSGSSGDRLPPEVETTVYRVVQEALTNAAKHGDPSRIGVGVSRGGDAVEATVVDDGSGFDPEIDSDGFGLRGMRERVELVGGELAIESTPGRGTTVRITIPLAAADHRAA